MIFTAPGFELMGSTVVEVTDGVLDATGLAEATGCAARTRAGNRTAAACINRTAARMRSSEGRQSSRLNRRCTEVCQRINRGVQPGSVVPGLLIPVAS